MIYYVLLLAMTMMGAFASFFLKKSSNDNKFFALLRNKYFYLGGLLYFFSALLNVYILRYLDYLVTLPLTSITYIWTMCLSVFMLKERITTKKIFGMLMIVGGAIFISVG